MARRALVSPVDRLAATAQRNRAGFPFGTTIIGLLGFAGVVAATASLGQSATADASFWDGLYEVLTRPATLVFLLPIAAGVALGAARRLRLWHLERTPGPIELTRFEYADSDGQEIPIQQLATDFARCLGEVQMYTTTSVPGAIPSVGFLQTLRNARFDPKKPLETIVDMLAAVWPTHAYELRLTLLQRSAARSRRGTAEARDRGITVELTELLRQRTSHITLWRKDWSAVVDAAAHHVAARVIPRTRGCKHTPWAAWAGQDLPLDVFQAYQQANALMGERRYDEALANYYRALDGDPGNAEIRYAVGLAQEKLSLHLDALLTYYRLMKHGERQARRRFPWNPQLPGRRATDRVTLLARYRFAIRLGFSERLARQWLSTGLGQPGPSPDPEGTLGWSLRDAERQDLRRQLRAILSARYASPRRPRFITGVIGLLDDKDREYVLGCLEKAQRDAGTAPAVDDASRIAVQALSELRRGAGLERVKRRLQGHDASLDELVLAILPEVVDLGVVSRLRGELRAGRISIRCALREEAAATASDLGFPRHAETIAGARGQVELACAVLRGLAELTHAGAGPTHRDRRRADWRITALGDVLGPGLRTLVLKSVLKRLLRDPEPGRQRGYGVSSEELRLRHLFQVLDDEEIHRLVRDTRFTVIRRTGTGLTAAALDITPHWVRLRRLRAAADRGIPAAADECELALPANLRIRLRLSRRFSDHYNAACAYAVLLRPPTEGAPTPTDLVDDPEQLEVAAVRHLRRGLSRATATQMGVWRPWILAEDPDLTGLRTTPRFMVFKAEHYPSSRGDEKRPAEAHRLQQSRHVARLLVEAARRFEDEWHRRGKQAGSGVDIHVVQDWWRRELAAWSWVRRFAVNHRHWQTRADAIKQLQSFASEHGQPPVAIRPPTYDEQPLRPADGEPLDWALDRTVRRTDEQFHVLARDLERRGPAPRPNGVGAAARLWALLEARTAGVPLVDADAPYAHLTWAKRLQHLDRAGRRLDAIRLRALCERRAAIWSALARWFEAPMEDGDAVAAARQEFDDIVRGLRFPLDVRQMLPNWKVSGASANGHHAPTEAAPTRPPT